MNDGNMDDLRDASRPLSPAQLPIWYAEMLRRDTPRWTQFSVTTLDGAVDRAKLERGLAAAAHYPALRTCLIRSRHGVRQVFHDPSGFRIGWRDLSGLPTDVRDRAVADILAEGERFRFKLHEHWLFRAEVLACAPERSLLLLFIHHIAADGMSLPLVLQRVALACRGETAEPDQHYERWLDRQGGPELEAGVAAARAFYRRSLLGATAWREQLYDRGENDGLPYDPPDLPQRTRVLDAAVVQGLSRLAERTASTLFIVCLAAYAVALGRTLDIEDLVIAVFASGRGGDTGLVAMAVNTLLVRLQLGGSTGAEALVRCAKEAWRPVRRLATVPIHALRQPGPGGTETREPDTVPDRVQFAINFLDMRTMTFDLPGVVSHTTYPQSAFPLNDLLLLLFREQEGCLRLRLFNGSGTPRISLERLGTVADTMAAVLRTWSGETQVA